MYAGTSAQIELLTDELRQLVGRGAHPMRLVTLPNLRELCRVDGSRLTARQQGSVIHRYLVNAVATLDGVYELKGMPVEGQTLRRVLRLLLKFEGSGQDADNRRARVITLLGLNYPLSQFRRPHSPERELVGILAEHMIQVSQIAA